MSTLKAIAVTLALGATSAACAPPSVPTTINEQSVVVDRGFVEEGPIAFEVTNIADSPQTIVIVLLRSGNNNGVIVPPFAPGEIPVIDGQVRHFTYFDEPLLDYWTYGPWWGGSRDYPPPPRPPDFGVTIAPGETVTLSRNANPEWEPGMSIVLLNDAPGAYEAGAWAALKVVPSAASGKRALVPLVVCDSCAAVQPTAIPTVAGPR